MLVDNLNLFFTILASSVTAFLGFVVFMHNRKSATNQIFILDSFIGVVWAVVNYLSIDAAVNGNIFIVRLVIFLAVPHVFSFLFFVINFPNEKFSIKKEIFIPIFILMIGMMCLTVSPFVFERLTSGAGSAVAPVPGKLMSVFAPILVIFFLLSFFLVIRKYFKAEGIIKRQWLVIGSGLAIAYTLLIFFVFVRVAVYQDTTFVIYSPLFILPIFIGAAYAILKHQLFRVKVIATELLTFGLLVASFIQLVLSESTTSLIINGWVFALLLFIGILLIRSVIKEVEQREELQKLTEQLKKANTELESLSKFKSQMLRLASHQIKAPLATIKGFASIIIDGLYGPVETKVKEAVVKMKDSSDELITLINDLLDLGKIEQGKMDYKFETIKIKDLIQKVMDGLKVQADTKKLEFTFVSSSEANISADSQKLKQVLQNLVENGVKYTMQGFVKVELKEDSDSVIFSVTDSGPGIVQSRLANLFDQELVRDERPEYKKQSTGTGLFIAKQIVVAHSGQIWAESEGEGKGSRFFVKLRKV